MTGIWTPEEGSDALLAQDSLAQSKVDNPYPAPMTVPDGMVPDDLDDDAMEERAALALAEADGDEPVEQVEVESGAVDDDEEVDDPDDTDPVGDEV
jgi:hypothetical protein